MSFRNFWVCCRDVAVELSRGGQARRVHRNATRPTEYYQPLNTQNRREYSQVVLYCLFLIPDMYWWYYDVGALRNARHLVATTTQRNPNNTPTATIAKLHYA